MCAHRRTHTISQTTKPQTIYFRPYMQFARVWRQAPPPLCRSHSRALYLSSDCLPLFSSSSSSVQTPHRSSCVVIAAAATPPIHSYRNLAACAIRKRGESNTHKHPNTSFTLTPGILYTQARTHIRGAPCAVAATNRDIGPVYLTSARERSHTHTRPTIASTTYAHMPVSVFPSGRPAAARRFESLCLSIYTHT